MGGTFGKNLWPLHDQPGNDFPPLESQVRLEIDRKRYAPSVVGDQCHSDDLDQYNPNEAPLKARTSGSPSVLPDGLEIVGSTPKGNEPAQKFITIIDPCL
jgi:hypothetical protein